MQRKGIASISVPARSVLAIMYDTVNGRDRQTKLLQYTRPQNTVENELLHYILKVAAAVDAMTRSPRPRDVVSHEHHRNQMTQNMRSDSIRHSHCFTTSATFPIGYKSVLSNTKKIVSQRVKLWGQRRRMMSKRHKEITTTPLHCISFADSLIT